jgi:pantothenate synthetase
MAKQHIRKFKNAKLDYLIVAETETLRETKQYKDQQIIALIAINYEGVRLLDNMILN